MDEWLEVPVDFTYEDIGQFPVWVAPVACLVIVLHRRCLARTSVILDIPHTMKILVMNESAIRRAVVYLLTRNRNEAA
jgi:hypothetical protein